eukprot:scaffold40890_cov66-Phaeocystis_antarctica.AAC.3
MPARRPLCPMCTAYAWHMHNICMAYMHACAKTSLPASTAEYEHSSPSARIAVMSRPASRMKGTLTW